MAGILEWLLRDGASSAEHAMSVTSLQVRDLPRPRPAG